jgi:hypothetical protein
MMDIINFNYLAIGIMIGYIANPLLATLSAIMIKILFNVNNSSCTQDCNQGRNCTCRNIK